MGEVLCYPGTDLSSFESRVKQLKELEVEYLILEGDSKVGKYGIVGRGCVSTVVKAKIKSEREIVALKIRRVDANRSDMSRDFELQKYANSFGVGPRAISASKDLFSMEFIDSTRLGKWFQALKTRTSKKYTRALIRNVLTQCCLLDINGLDHGEAQQSYKTRAYLECRRAKDDDNRLRVCEPKQKNLQRDCPGSILFSRRVAEHQDTKDTWNGERLLERRMHYRAETV